MRILVFDTETTGLPKSKIIDCDTLNLHPYIVQFSYVIYDTNFNDIVEKFDEIVNLQDTINISEESTKIHGITNDICKKNGINIELILDKFFNDFENIDFLVGHNISFDINMVEVELLRLINYNQKYCNFHDSIFRIKHFEDNLKFLKSFKNIYCTLKESIDFCKIKTISKYGKEYNKFPKLNELHNKLFEIEPNKLHNSFNDVLVTLRCFMKLKYNIDLNDNCNIFQKFCIELEIL